jgi:hypothetical protein
MEIIFSPNEEILLAFKLSNGSGWLTNYRLILCEHELGHLEGHVPEIFSLKNFKKAKIQGALLTILFRGKRQAELILPEKTVALLEEIKEYIEEAAKYCK